MKYLFTLLFACLLGGCALNSHSGAAGTAQTAPKPKAKSVKKSGPASSKQQSIISKQIIGSIEPVRLIPPDIVVRARVDTGATTTSINAREIVPFERDGKPWVRFLFTANGKEYRIEKPVEKRIRIKQHNSPSNERYVIKMRLVLGETSQVVSVSLSDRGQFKYPVLIGRNFLRDVYIVDVAKKLSTTPKSD